jgi:hypothetical protein
LGVEGVERDAVGTGVEDDDDGPTMTETAVGAIAGVSGAGVDSLRVCCFVVLLDGIGWWLGDDEQNRAVRNRANGK